MLRESPPLHSGKQTTYSENMDFASIVKAIAALLSLDLIPVMVDAYRAVRKLITHEYHEGLYEVFEYDAVLELLDTEGKIAVFKKRLRVKFLQDYVLAFQDYAWGDGDIFVEYKCSPGVVVDRYPEGNRWNVLISLRETKNSGDIADFYIERKVVGGFTTADEWWQVEMQNQTRWLKLSVIFPPGRHCERPALVEKQRNRTTPLDSTHLTDLPDGRQMLTWETHKPKRFESYLLKWHW